MKRLVPLAVLLIGCAAQQASSETTISAAPRVRWVAKLPPRPPTPALPETPVPVVDGVPLVNELPAAIQAKPVTNVKLEPIALPDVIAISALAPLSSDTVLASSNDGTLLEIKGNRAKRLGQTDCKDLGPPYPNVEGKFATQEPTVNSIVVSKDEITLNGYSVRFGRGSWNIGYTVTIPKAATSTPKNWKCRATGAPVVDSRWSEGIQWTTENYGTYLRRALYGGGYVPISEFFEAWAPAGPTHAWYTIKRESSVFAAEYNGLAWRARPLPPEIKGVDAIYADSSGRAWFAVKAGSAPGLLLWDGQKYRYIAVPADFVVSHFDTDGTRLWAFGAKRWFAIENEAVTSMDAPMTVVTTMLDGKHLWVAGSHLSKDAAATPRNSAYDELARAGMLVRLSSTSESSAP